MSRWLAAFVVYSSSRCVAGAAESCSPASAGDLVTVETAADTGGGATVWLVQMTSKAKRPAANLSQMQTNESLSRQISLEVVNQESSSRLLHEKFAFDHGAIPTLQAQLTQEHSLMQAGSNSTTRGAADFDAADSGLQEPSSMQAGLNSTARSAAKFDIADAGLQVPSLMQAGSNATAAAKLDTADAGVMFYAMVIMILFYFVLGGWMLASGKDDNLTWETSLRNAYSRAHWPLPRPDVMEQVLPAISGFMVGFNDEFPLLIPIKGLEERTNQAKNVGGWFANWFSPKPSKVAWSLDILSNKQKNLFTVRQMKYSDGSLGHLEVIGHYGGRPDSCLARMDSKLTLYKEDGTEFGRLVKKQSGAYELAEHATGRHRWLVTPTLDEGSESFTFTWRPRRNVMASVSRGHHQHAGFMKVMTSKGVDAVLVTLCVIGLFVFRIDREEESEPAPKLQSTGQTQASSKAGPRDRYDGAQGFAGSLLQQPAQSPWDKP